MSICDKLSICWKTEDNMIAFFKDHAELSETKQHLAQCQNCLHSFAENGRNFLEKKEEFYNFFYETILTPKFSDELDDKDHIMRELVDEILEKKFTKEIPDWQSRSKKMLQNIHTAVLAQHKKHLLQKTSAGAAIPHLFPLLNSDNPEDQKVAIATLEKYGKEFFPHLVRIIKEGTGTTFMLSAVAKSFGILGLSEAVPELNLLLEVEDEVVRSSAKQALEMIQKK